MKRLSYIIVALVSISIAIVVTAAAESANSVPSTDVIIDIINGSSKAHYGQSISGDINLKHPLSEKHLNKSNLSNMILITNCRIDGSVDFSDLIFENRVDLKGTTIAGSVNFRRATFNSSLNLSNATFLKDVHFEDATLKGGIILEGANFGGDYGHLYLRWNSIRDDKYDDSTYLALINNYEWLTKNDNYNWSNDANYCYIDYRNKRLGLRLVKFSGLELIDNNLCFIIIWILLLLVSAILLCVCRKYFNTLCSNQSACIVFILLLVVLFIIVLDKTLDFLTFISSGYGRRPSYTVGLSLLLILLFSLYARLRYHDIKSYTQSFWLNAAIFLSAHTRSDDKEIIGQMGPLAVIERALGLLLLAIFIATLNNVVIIRGL